MKIKLIFIVFAFSVAANAQPAKKVEGSIKNKTSKEVFIPVFWSEEISASKYLLNEPSKVFGWVNRSMENIAKSLPKAPDEFSTKEEREQYKVALTEKAKIFPPIPLQVACKKEYLPDNQTFSFLISANRIDHRLKYGQQKISEDVDYVALKIRKIVIPGGISEIVEKYIGQTSFGVTTGVTKVRETSYFLAIPAGMANEPIKDFKSSWPGLESTDYMLGGGSYQLKASMPPDQARIANPDIACIAVVSLSVAPLVYGFDYVEPTIDDPKEVSTRLYGFFGKLDRFLVFNKRTGEIYAKIVRDNL